MNAWHKHEFTRIEERIYTDPEHSMEGMADWRKRHAFLVKTLAFVLIFAFIIYDITWAQGGSPIWQHAKPTLPLNGKPQVNGIQVPYEAGTTQDAYSNGGKEAIINIQDAHSSLSAQHSIVKILQDLSSNYDLNLIALEGAEGPIDISLLRTFPDKEIRRETAEYLMRKGKMSAGEFFAIVNEKPIKLYGVENDALYKKNLASFKSVMKGKLASIKNAENILKTLKALEDKVYSKDLKVLNQNSVLPVSYTHLTLPTKRIV